MKRLDYRSKILQDTVMECVTKRMCCVNWNGFDFSFRKK